MLNEPITVNGRTYLARGWLNGVSAPVGTILGPTYSNEYLTVVESEPHRVRVAHTRIEDYREMGKSPRSVCEHRLIVDGRQIRR